MVEKPLIGVCGPDERGEYAWAFTKLAIWRAGGGAIRITPSRPVDIDLLDGLVLGGGADIDPARYGEKMVTKRSRLARKTVADLLMTFRRRDFDTEDGTPWLDPDRDRTEFPLVREAARRHLPVLGICRGAQVIAVANGGALVQDVVPFYSWPPYVRSLTPIKRIWVRSGSDLSRALRLPSFLVNTLHRQAVKDPGQGLRVVARETNGLIQAVESTARKFIIGVQWHPEYMPQVARQQNLFRSLVQAARRYRDTVRGHTD